MIEVILTVFGLFLGGMLVYTVLKSLFPDYQDLPRWREYPVSKAVQAGSGVRWPSQGYVPGGMYAGITYIPGDPYKPWEEGEDSISSCPACEGVMRKIYQTSDLEQDGEFIVHYKEVCKECNFLNDTGRKMTAREARASQYVYCDVVKGNTFNRSGHSCDFIDPEFNEPVTRMNNWCDECPHPH